MVVPDPAPITIRPATGADLERLVDLLWAVAAEGRWVGIEVPFDRGRPRAGFEGLLARDDATILVVAAGEQIVGYITLSIARYGVADLSMLVLDRWRGRGLGTGLLTAGLDWARQAGAHKAFLEVWPDNEAAIALYRRTGFVEEGRKRRHYRRASGELWDAILMGLPLTGEPASDPSGGRV